jgi:hypothetical protein
MDRLDIYFFFSAGLQTLLFFPQIAQESIMKN